MKKKLLLAAGLLMASGVSHAQIITVNYTGTVTDLGVLLSGDVVSIGDSVVASFSYDTNGGGVVDTFDIAIGGSFSASLASPGNMNVQNDQQNGSATQPADGLTVGASNTTSSALNGHTNPYYQFGLRRENVLGQLWNDTLPPDLGDWAGVTLADLNAADWHWMDFGLNNPPTDPFRDDQIRWDVDSFTVSAVPVPAAVWLFGSGLLGLLGVSRRKRLAQAR